MMYAPRSRRTRLRFGMASGRVGLRRVAVTLALVGVLAGGLLRPCDCPHGGRDGAHSCDGHESHEARVPRPGLGAPARGEPDCVLCPNGPLAVLVPKTDMSPGWSHIATESPVVRTIGRAFQGGGLASVRSLPPTPPPWLLSPPGLEVFVI